MLHCKFIRVNHRLIAIEGCQVGDLSVEEREKKEKERRMQWMKRFISWIQDCYFQWELASMLVVMDPVEKYFFRIFLSKCKHHFFKHTSS